jgi:exodeoxyribonuclease-5
MIIPEGQQVEAIDKIVKWSQSKLNNKYVLHGNAGTGKTSIIPFIRSEAMMRSVVCTYTNKAAAVVREKGISDATTIFRIMYDLEDPVNMVWRKRQRLPYDLVIVDESSMIGKRIRTDLESYGVKVLYIGDKFQLPPVGDDESSVMDNPDFSLTEVRRQAKGSPIIKTLTAIREGRKYPDVDQYDLSNKEIAEFDAVICLSNVKRRMLNERIRTVKGFKGDPKPGDRVMICKTDYEYGLFAGESGFLEDWDGRYRATVLFDGAEDPTTFTYAHFMKGDDNPYDRKFMGRQMLDYAYAITAHKSQGSEWPSVLVWMEYRSDRRWTYTAASRAQEKLLIGGC